LTIALAVALPLGIIAAFTRAPHRPACFAARHDRQAMPSFWLGLVLMIVLGLKLQWLRFRARQLGELCDAGVTLALPGFRR